MTDTTLEAPEPLAEEGEESLAHRRLTMFVLTGGTMVALGLLMTQVMGGRGWTVASAAFLVLFLAGLPWTLLGFWNSVIGFIIMRLARDPVAYTNPAMTSTPLNGPITARTAICLCVRHEDVRSVFGRLAVMADAVAASEWQDRFDFHVLSDSARPEIAEAEESAFSALKTRYTREGFLHYRRRAVNTGYKAGNLTEFARRARGSYHHMIVLDADSLMSAEAMFRLVRAMQANPRLGILQTLVVGRPSDSAFTRIFQFGMRQSMRVHTIGAAWWQGSSGPYWGHNAIIRIAPFVEHCDIPDLPGKPPLGGPVLSHDQVEAALMRAGGYEVRVIADEFESWEENPPSLPDFIKRDLRWCQGNMQYVKLLGRISLRPMGYFQLANAIMMYLGAVFGVLMLFAGISMILDPEHGFATTRLAFGLYFGMIALGFAPHFLGTLDIVLRGEARLYGGIFRLAGSAVFDVLFSFLLGPVMMIAQALFVVGLIFGRRVTWDSQNRRERAVPFAEAARGLWPQFLFACGVAGIMAVEAPGILPWAAPTILPGLLAVPFTSLTSGAFMGRLLTRPRLCAIPDEFAPSPTLKRLDEA